MKFKKTFLATVVICWAICASILATEIWAVPYLACDCTPAVDTVTGFQLQFGTQTPIEIPASATCGTGTNLVTCTAPQVLICYDLGTMPNGTFTVKALAVNTWGVSDRSLPLSGTKQLPTSPSPLKIIKK